MDLQLPLRRFEFVQLGHLLLVLQLHGKLVVARGVFHFVDTAVIALSQKDGPLEILERI